MKRIAITVHNSTNVDRREEPVSIGIPLPQGEIHETNALVLTNDNGSIVAAQFTPLNQWHDGSLQWVLLDFQPIASANTTSNYFLEKTTNYSQTPEQGITVKDQGSIFRVNTGSSVFFLNKKDFLPFTSVNTNNVNFLKEDASCIILRDENEKEYFPVITATSVELKGNLRSTIKIEGVFRSGQEELLSFISRVNFFYKKSFIKIDFTIWNKGAAQHAGGLWDLGDPGSVLFRSLVIRCVLSENIVHEKHLRRESGKIFEKINGQSITLYQDSSGGEYWYSTNHINRNLQIPLSFRGYKVYQDDKVISRGLRATPILYIGDKTKGVSATVRHFWQNFPKAISAQADEITIELYPDRFNDLHELQGGERKTHSLFLDFGGPPDALNFVECPLRACVSRQWYAETGAVPYLSKAATMDDQPYDDLVASAVTGEKSFFVKREIIDEYGWRNFGEVYADHEAVGHKGEKPLISHYNNQYDQVYGFFREFIASGNEAWFELMDDLAHHVCDIDIYHTKKDKDEYNNGLHWHTNHYLDAATCTHRSVSKMHLDKHDPRFYGGGPGMEHCYGTGFMYHYYLTGEESSREALLTLTDWICHCIGEPETVLGAVNKIKSLLPQWKQVLQGAKGIRADRYPLTRGSGNPIAVLLDAFVITHDKFYLHKAEEIVKGCIHPHDNIESRDLLDAENSWSYTVCLQAIGKYLDVKIAVNELDYMYAYAQAALLHYANWMLENEYPYLEKPEILEYPNETWPAQDLRKSCIFYFAAKHSTGKEKKIFLEKAEYFHFYVINKLNDFDTKLLARPIALLMQNRWMHAYFAEHPDKTAPRPTGKYDFTRTSEFLSRGKIIKNIVSSFFHALKTTSVKKELHWWRCRRNKHIS